MLFQLTSESQLPGPGEAKEFPCEGKYVCVANVDGTYCAIDNVCLHRGGPLGQGFLDGSKIICPWHGWEWEVKTGQAVHVPNAKVPVYQLKIENGEVMVEL